MSRSGFDDPNLRKHARQMLLRKVNGHLENGQWAEACKLIGVNPKVALATPRAFKTALADAGVDWHSNPVSRWKATREEKRSQYLGDDVDPAAWLEAGDMDGEEGRKRTRNRPGEPDAFDVVERRL